MSQKDDRRPSSSNTVESPFKQEYPRAQVLLLRAILEASSDGTINGDYSVAGIMGLHVQGSWGQPP